MSPDPTFKPPRADPTRFDKPLAFIVPLLLAGPLALVECLYVNRLNYTRESAVLPSVLFFAVALLVCLYFVKIGFCRLVQPEPAIEELEQALARQLPADGLICRGRDQAVIIDPARQVLQFENFRFVTQFVSSDPFRPKEDVLFSEILGLSEVPSRFSSTLTLRTVKGQVQLDSGFENYRQFADILESMIALNRAHPEQYQQALNAEPVLKLAWYGWLLLLAGFGAVVFVGWKFLSLF